MPGNSTQDPGQGLEGRELSFIDDVVRPGSWIRFAFLAERFEFLAGRQDFYIQAVITNERDDLAVGVKRIFAKHGARGEVFRLPEFSEEEIHGFFLGRHAGYLTVRRKAMQRRERVAWRGLFPHRPTCLLATRDVV